MPIELTTTLEWIVAIETIILFIGFVLKPVINVGKVVYKRYIGVPDKTNTERIEEVQQEIEVLKQGQQALLRNQIITHAKAAIKKGSISDIELKNLDEMSKPYKALGGNGVTAQLVEECNKLKLEVD